MSGSINIGQGYRHGGILSADLYKVYVNLSLDNARVRGKWSTKFET